jgi:hypothetical protein
MKGDTDFTFCSGLWGTVKAALIQPPGQITKKEVFQLTGVNHFVGREMPAVVRLVLHPTQIIVFH